MLPSTLNHITNRRLLPLAISCVLLLTIGQAQVPKFNSNSSSTSTVYLDFDGHYATGTLWNWDSSFQAMPAQLDQSAITEIFNRVAEDYRIFNLNITTDSLMYAKAPVDKRVRVIVTPTQEWYGVAGGVAIIGSFTSGDGTPAWVFSNLLENNPKYVGEAASHEIGHTLGLQHQSSFDNNCQMINEYAEGRGDGEISWAPIMGVGYYKNLTTWHTGPNVEGCSVIQNDIDVISNGYNKIGIRTDDHSNTMQQATPLSLYGTSFQSNGMISNGEDKDVFTFTISGPSSFHTKATPNHVASGNSGANIDIQISLLSANGDTVGRYNPTNLLSASIDTNLYAGKYFLVIDGVGNRNISDYGSIGYYSLDGSLQRSLPITQLNLSGKIKGHVHLLSWRFLTDELAKTAEVEVSTDGIHFSSINTLNPSVNSIQYNPSVRGSFYYRVKMITEKNEKAYYSNTVSLQSGSDKDVSLVSNLISNTVRIKAPSSYNYRLLDETGRTLQQGTVNAGMNNIPVNTFKKGLLLLKVFRGNEQYLFKLIKQ